MASNYTDVLTHFWYFLTAYVHTVLYLRSVYSQHLFMTARLHNAEVYQSRSPELCQYINDVTMSIHAKLLEGNISRIGIVLYTREDKDESIQVRERYVLDVSTFCMRILNVSNTGCGKGGKDSCPVSSPVSAENDLPSTPHYQQHTPP
jgi:mitotic spindle assembly checkpoint protein MAD2B